MDITILSLSPGSSAPSSPSQSDSSGCSPGPREASSKTELTEAQKQKRREKNRRKKEKRRQKKRGQQEWKPFENIRTMANKFSDAVATVVSVVLNGSPALSRSLSFLALHPTHLSYLSLTLSPFLSLHPSTSFYLTITGNHRRQNRRSPPL